ncbi:hypothetical protein ACTVMR_02115 [Serratia nevei]|uniref:hypothetical protein n=1 Tax=Serratia nevei TaxID=2703794 RepID=UPI003FA79AF4
MLYSLYILNLCKQKTYVCYISLIFSCFKCENELMVNCFTKDYTRLANNQKELFMKVLDPSILDFVSGGRGNNGGDRVDNGGRTSSGKGGGSNNTNGGYYSKQGDAITNCNNGIIGGMIAGSLGGVGGLAVGLVGGAIAGGCFSNQGSNGGQSSNAGSKNNCNNSMGGSCKV